MVLISLSKHLLELGNISVAYIHSEALHLVKILGGNETVSIEVKVSEDGSAGLFLFVVHFNLFKHKKVVFKTFNYTKMLLK